MAYRNYGDHESLVTNHTVAMDGNVGLTSQTGVGWYEIRQPNAATPQVHQDGVTADPNGSTFRWMASIAMDKQGNTALGYSTSDATPGPNSFPSIRYIGRKVSDRRLHHLLRSLGGLLGDERRPGRRLHVLVHQRVRAEQ
ncbi:MAG: hypothetical protein IPG68_05785 [Micrococcales bacterium]|nr:hypothetical protein [Micrococcales bacterium]